MNNVEQALDSIRKATNFAELYEAFCRTFGISMSDLENMEDEERIQEGIQAWEQVQRDMKAWGESVDQFIHNRKAGLPLAKLMTVCKTSDVYLKLGASDLPMTLTADNLAKIMSNKQDHNLPIELVKQLPRALAEPIMVFDSATQDNSFVVLTSLKNKDGRSIMVAVHLDTKRQHARVNNIASAYSRGNARWYLNQIEDGRLLYQDKKKSLAWARTDRLQLPRVRKLPARLVENKLLTEQDVVKPIDPATVKTTLIGESVVYFVEQEEILVA